MASIMPYYNDSAIPNDDISDMIIPTASQAERLR